MSISKNRQAIDMPATTAISNAEIRNVFLANGFQIKPGHDDLRPYVYDAARALISMCGAAAHIAEPATHIVPDHLIERLRKHCDDKGNTAFARSSMREALEYLAPAPPADGQPQQNGARRYDEQVRKLQAPSTQQGADKVGHTDVGRNMFFEGRFDDETEQEQKARLAAAQQDTDKVDPGPTCVYCAAAIDGQVDPAMAGDELSDGELDAWAEDIARLGYEANVEGVNRKLRALLKRVQPASGEDARDAARYQWLRDCGAQFDELSVLDSKSRLVADALDDEIDAVMQQGGRHE